MLQNYEPVNSEPEILEFWKKNSIYEKAKEKNAPYEHIEGMWRKYLQQNLVNIREEFLRKSREKKIPEGKIKELWKKYLAYL